MVCLCSCVVCRDVHHFSKVLQTQHLYFTALYSNLNHPSINFLQICALQKILESSNNHRHLNLFVFSDSTLPCG